MVHKSASEGKITEISVRVVNMSECTPLHKNHGVDWRPFMGHPNVK